MSEFRENWSESAILDMPEVSEELHFKYVIIGGGNSAGYAAKTLVDCFSQENPLNLDLRRIQSELVSEVNINEEAEVSKNIFAIISAEVVPPYERPALSKAYLNPPGSKIRLRLPNFLTTAGNGGEVQTKEWYEKNKISLMLGHQAIDIDCEAQRILCDRREDRKVIAISYEKLIIATGVKPLFTSMFYRSSILANIFALRNESDASSIVSALESLNGKNKKVVVVGGGYIGLECAAAFAGWDIDVTIVFPEDNILARIFTTELSTWYERLFEQVKGITIIRNTKVSRFSGKNGKVTHAELTNGKKIECDLAVVGIGSVLNSELFKDQVLYGLNYVQGVKVDKHLQTSDPNIFAVGDVAAIPFMRGFYRFEHVGFCRKTAELAVKNMLVESHNFVVDDGSLNCEEKLQQKEELSYLPFYYSRLFEYTDSPICFNFYGDTGDDLPGAMIVHFGDFDSLEPKPKGAFWFDKNSRVIGGLLCCGTQLENDELKKIVQCGRRVQSFDEKEVTSLFGSFTSRL